MTSRSSNLIRNKTLSKAVRGVLVIAFFYLLFIWGISTNPPGFYIDESCLAYNGYLIATTGTAENGESFPLFFQCYTDGLVQYAHPTNIYLLATMYLVIPPSIVSARVLAATIVFIALLLLGLLAARISDRPLIGGIVTLTGMATPWLFEISRLVLETFVFVFSVPLFLFCLYNAQKREKWKVSDSCFLAISLALITYSYTPGRFLGPAFAFGLLLFAKTWRALWDIMKAWAFYFLTLIPLIVVYFTNGYVITKRLAEVTYILPDKPWFAIATEFVNSFLSDLSPGFLLFEGDTIRRHHAGPMGEIFAATFVIGVVGVIVVLLRHRCDNWWRFILFGLIISVVPGAVTVHRHHALRLLAFPIFLLILTVPALSWFIGDEGPTRTRYENGTTFGRIPTVSRGLSVSDSFGSVKVKRSILIILLLLTCFQAVYFHAQFRELGSKRRHAFDASYPKVLEVAVAQQSRPIYLKDGSIGGPAYTHAFWYGAINGIDRSNCVHLRAGESPPSGSIVLSSDLGCTNCTNIFRDDNFSLYRTR